MKPSLSLSDPRRPKYWQQETSGLLQPVIAKLLDPGEPPLTRRDIDILRLYFQQWVDSPVWDENPHANERSSQVLQELRNGVRALGNRHDVVQWLAAAEREGMDPL